jgi:hypothetical protein
LSPTAAGVYLGLDTSAPGEMEICCSSSPYIDFTTISNDFKGRIIYNHGDNSFYWPFGGGYTNAMRLLSTGLSVTGTVSSSDQRLKFNEKPLINAIGVINRLELVKYDQTVIFNRTYTEGTPLFHQCGFIVQKN